MIPSLLQIPSAVSDSKLHSVLPNNGKGDFTFDRSTGATRINKDGLIEEVGYFSSELVQNGNFSELGSELIINGDFATDSAWNKLNATISGGKGNLDGVGQTSLLWQTILTQNKFYKTTFTISNYNGTGNARLINNDGSSIYEITSNGTFTVYFQHTIANGNFLFRATSGAVYSIDNVSVKQVDPNDRWILGTGWGYGDGVVSCDGTQTGNTDCSQNLPTPTGKTYKITYTISEYTSGGVFIRLGSGNATTTQASVGTFSEILNGADATQVKIRANSTFVGTISNISVVEVQGDRPRLSYDITNGVVEDKPHLLLEPSSTNLFTFSENFTDWNGYQATSNSTTAPDGSSVLFLNFEDVRMFPTTTISSSTEYTASIYLKANKAAQVKVRNIRGSDTAITLTTDWVRYKFTATSTSTSTNALLIDARFSQGLGATGLEIALFGAQIEAQSFATSYIPTAGTTITRAAETCNNSKPSVNSTEGVLYAEIAALADDSTDRRITISDGTTNNRMCIGFDNASNKIKYFLISSNSSQVNEDVSVSDITQSNKIAFKFKANDFELYMNGSVIASDTSGSTFSANTLDVIKFAGFTGTTQEFYGKVKGLAVYNEALTDAQLIELTS